MESWRERSVRRKLEQATDPVRPLHRGFFKGARPKGRKARLDELVHARKEFFYYLDHVEDDKGRWVERGGRRVESLFAGWHKEWLERSRTRFLKLLAECER